MVEYLIEEFGDEHVLLGTDYPFDMGPTDPLAFLAQVKMNEQSRERILGGNAARLFKIGT
jgi:aminocarboxymuconate-semialdehyde decarboxylase